MDNDELRNYIYHIPYGKLWNQLKQDLLYKSESAIKSAAECYDRIDAREYRTKSEAYRSIYELMCYLDNQ